MLVRPPGRVQSNFMFAGELLATTVIFESGFASLQETSAHPASAGKQVDECDLRLLEFGCGTRYFTQLQLAASLESPWPL